MGLVKGIHHVCVKCDSPEKYQEAIAFYRDVLGLPVKRRWAGGITLDTGAGYIEIFDNAESPLPQGAVRHFALATDDVDALAGAVEAAGYRITVPLKNVTLPTEPPYPIRIAFCEGPVGEEIELFQEL